MCLDTCTSESDRAQQQGDANAWIDALRTFNSTHIRPFPPAHEKVGCEKCEQLAVEGGAAALVSEEQRTRQTLQPAKLASSEVEHGCTDVMTRSGDETSDVQALVAAFQHYAMRGLQLSGPDAEFFEGVLDGLGGAHSAAVAEARSLLAGMRKPGERDSGHCSAP